MSEITSGIDVIEIDRIEAAIDRWGSRFLQRIYTDGEQAYCHGKARRFAGRFAAKEAASKALGVGVRHIRWREIEILPDARGKPCLTLHGRAREVATRLGLTGFEVSITHSRTDAIAVVIAWQDRDR
jgi:holo-[acyl-carrier protein] synthase